MCVAIYCFIMHFTKFIVLVASASMPGPSTNRGPSIRTLVPMKQPRQVNLEEFKEVQSEILEEPAHTWVRALINVNTDSANILDCPDSELLRGYALPDPFLFINAFNNNKDLFAKFLYVWLSFRAAWMARFTSQQGGSKPLAKMPLPQHWRDYLMKVGQSVGVSFGSSGNPTSGPDTNAKPAKKKMRKEKFIEEMDNIFDLNLDLCGSLSDLYWKGSIIKPTAAPVTTLPPLQMIKEIIWEIIEDNWRLELLALDRILLS